MEDEKTSTDSTEYCATYDPVKSTAQKRARPRHGPFLSMRLVVAAYGTSELKIGPPSTGTDPLPWSCGTPTVTSPLHDAPTLSVAE